MKKMMILIAAIAMTTLAVQADNVAPVTSTVAAMDTQAPAPVEGDTNGTEEEAPEGK
jgi:hypothetical protein